MLVGIITLIVSGIVVFNHQLVWLLAVFPGLYIAYAFFIAFSKAPDLKDNIHLTHSEKEAWQQHHAFIRFPSAARSMAGALSMLQFISITLAVVLAVTGAYWGLAFALGWFILGLATPRLNPATTYVPAAQKGNSKALRRAQALESLQNKLNNPDTGADHKKDRPKTTHELEKYKEGFNKYLPDENYTAKQTATDELEELIQHWTRSIVKAPIIVWTESDLMSQRSNSTRTSKEIYATAGMIYLAEHMLSRNVKDKAKIEYFANKLIDSASDSLSRQMLNNSATRAEIVEFSNMVKKGYFFFWMRKEAAENSPKGATDMIIDKLHSLDTSLSKEEIEDKLRDYLVGQRFADFANIASRVVGGLNIDRK